MRAINTFIQTSVIPAVLVALVLSCLALGPKAVAVAPPPDGSYPGNNTAEGFQALQNLTTGTNNTALGFQALFHDTTGLYNSATGFRALFSNLGGGYNVADGLQALFGNRTGNYNVAQGVNALRNNTTGNYNVAQGTNALFANTTANFNTANGAQALFHNTTGTNNTAHGFQALFDNTEGGSNVAVGVGALNKNTTGGNNTAVGDGALMLNTSGSFNIALGASAGTDPGIGSNNIYIGDAGFGGDNNVIAIGAISATGTAFTKCFIGGISGTIVTGAAVQVGTDGQLGVAASSKRFKEDIKAMARASESILALQPVTFRYKKEIDAGSARQFGLVAEEVAEVNPDLVIYRGGQPYTVRYDQVNAMLLNEFLKEHRKVEQLQLTLSQQQKEMQTVLARLKKQESQIQKVTAQIELSKATPKTVVKDN